jgi:SAM-dependent methyltransferase
MMQSGSAQTYRGAYQAVHLTEEASRKVLWGVLTEYLARYVPPGSHVLELGAGYCYWINGVRAARKVAVDLWEDLPGHTAADVEPVVLDVASGLRGLGERQFDVVLASNLLEHFEPDVSSQVVADVASLLRPRGRFIVLQPNFRYAFRHYFDDYTHRAIFTDVSLANLLRSHGFGIEALHPKFMPYSLRGSRLPVKPWLIRMYLRSPIKPMAGQMLIVGRKS